MTYYDAAMIGVIVAGMVWGLFRGITWQVASISSLVLGYFGAHTLSSRLVGYFPGEPVVARSLAMLSVYVGISAAVFGLAWLVRATLRKLKFEAYDRHLGMLLGGCEGAFVGVVVTLFVVSLAPKTREPIFSSPSGKVVGAFMSAIGPALPEEARQVLKPFLNAPSDDADLAHAEIEPLPDLPPQGRGSKANRGTNVADSDPVSTDSGSESLTGLIQQGKAKLKKAISDQVDDQIRQTTESMTNTLKQATGGASDHADGRTVERR